MKRLIFYFVALCTFVMFTITGCDNASNIPEDTNASFSPDAVASAVGEGTSNSGSGTASPDNSTVTYTAGPFAVPNTTGTAGEIQCGTGTPCDHFDLTVETPAGFGVDHEMQIQIEWPNSAADFDLYVFDESGDQIASAASLADPETVILPPTTGDYTVRIVPYAPLGETVTGTISLNETDPSSNSEPSTAEAPTYTNYVAPEGLPNRDNAGEPSIGVNWNTGSVMYQANISTYRVKFDDRNSPATDNWTDVSARLPECTAVTSFDPILWTDHETGRTFESQLLVNPILNSATCFTDDDGDNWTVSQGGGIASGVDHQTIGGGPFAERGVGPITQYPNAVYYCSQDVATALCAVSRDGGLTFGAANPIYTIDECGGLHGQIKVGPQGTAYVPNGRCNGQQAVVVSNDNGTKWAVRRNPNSTADIGSDPGVEIGSNGTVYLGYQNGDGNARAAVSFDKGQTWEFDQDVGAQLGVENIVFPKVIAGDDDRAAFTFIGTTTGGDYEADDFDGIWSLYVATTYDGGESWVTVNATPNDPVQRGSICTGGTACDGDRNLLDFIGIDVDREGRVLVGWADGCVGDCVASGPNSFTDVGTITRQSSGLGLFTEFDPVPQADLTASDVSASETGKGGNNNKDPKANKATTVTATIANTGEAGADNVLVRFMDGSTQIGETTVNVGAGSSREVSINWEEDKERGDHVITVVADANDAIDETNEQNNKAQETVTFRQ